MKLRTILLAICAQTAAQTLLTYPSYAFDLAGAWSTDATVCEKIFAKKGKAISFNRNSGLYGNGFIVEGNTIRGQMSKCDIKDRKEDGTVIHLIAVCASDILLDKVQLSYKVIGDNDIVRLVHGMEDMEIRYSRCAFKK